MTYSSGSFQNLVADTAALSPPEHLCDLVEGVSAGTLSTVALAVLDRAMRTDRLSTDDREVLMLLAPLLARAVPEHPSIGILGGMRRLSQVRSGSVRLLVAQIRDRFDELRIPTLVACDLGVAQALYADPADRAVTSATVLVPKGTSREERRAVVSEAARDVDATQFRGAEIGAERMGVRVVVRADLARPFGFAAARDRIWRSAQSRVEQQPHPAPEMLLLESVYRSALGAPVIRWYADAVFALAKHADFDWDEFAAAAEDFEWTAPATEAMRVLAMRGYSVPDRQLPQDRFSDRAFWQARRGGTPRSRTARLQYRMWVVSRLSRHVGNL